jgi:hypothetical protein
MGTSSNTSSSSNVSNTGANTNSTSVSQPINPVYNLNVSQSLPGAAPTVSGGTLSNGIIEPINSNFKIKPLLIGGVIVLIILIIILIK